MKTEQESLQEIKQRVKLFWNATYFQKEHKKLAFGKLMEYVSGLLWVIYARS